MTHAIHVCLVSQEPTPNLTPVFDPALTPREVILVVTPEMERRADWLEAVLRPRRVKVSRWPIERAYDLEHVRDRLLALVATRAGDDLALNVTGGTKPMSIAAYEVFRAAERPVFYVDPVRDRVIWLHDPAGPRQAAMLADRIKLAAFLQEGMLEGAIPSQDPHQLALSLASLHLGFFALPILVADLLEVEPEEPRTVTARKEAARAQTRKRYCRKSREH